MLDDIYNALQGRWRVVYSELNGEMTAVSDFSTIVLINNGNNFSIEKNGVLAHEGKFSLNINVKPYQLVYIYSKAPDIFLGAPRSGIFQLYGNTFKTCMSAIGHPPPQDFNTWLDSESVLSIHQREGAAGLLVVQATSTRAVSQW